jgi:hypothetical protein
MATKKKRRPGKRAASGTTSKRPSKSPAKSTPRKSKKKTVKKPVARPSNHFGRTKRERQREKRLWKENEQRVKKHEVSQKNTAKKLAIAYLAARGIVRGYLKNFEYESLSPNETASLAAHFQAEPSMLIVYRDLFGERLKGYHRIRYLNKVWRNNGKTIRFTGSSGMGPFLYFARTWPNRLEGMTWAHIAKHIETEIFITEGEVKACALARIGRAAIGLAGVYSFLKDGKLLPEFADIEWEGRHVVIVFDNDIVNKPNVRQAMARLIRELTNLGALPKILKLPDYEMTGVKVGIDDFLVKHKFAPSALGDLELEDCEETVLLHDLNSIYYIAPEGGKVLIHDERDGEMYSVTDFKTLYMNKYALDVEGKRKPLGHAWLGSPIRRQYDRTVFDPAAHDDPRVYNRYKGFAFEPRPGDWSLFRAHIAEIICGGNSEYFEYLLNWMARCVQYPGERAEVAIVLRGEQGTGKGIFASSFSALFNPHTYHASSAGEITGKFSGHLKDVLVIFMDEAFYAGDRSQVGTLKKIVTEKLISIEEKYLKRVEIPNRLKIIIASNEHWVIPAGMQERRFLMLNVASAKQQQTKYFNAIVKQLNDGGYEALLHDLLTRDISKFKHRFCPKTEALAEQQLYSMTTVESYWLEILDAGALPSASHGLKGQGPSEDWGLVATKILHKDFVTQARDRGLSHLPDLAQFGRQLKQLLPRGYPEKVRPKCAGGRFTAWRFPPLEACRKCFAARQGGHSKSG